MFRVLEVELLAYYEPHYRGPLPPFMYLYYKPPLLKENVKRF
jgi:hypothetical protein